MRPSRPRYALIDSKVQQILALANAKHAPIDVEGIAVLLNARVVRNDFKDEISGVLVRRPGEEVVIGVELSQSQQRQRFTIAHELGHLVLHDLGDVHVDKVNYRSSLSSTAEDVEEVEANAFAAALLMPRSLIVADLQGQTVNIEDDAQVNRLAEKYGVSSQAMTYRLINIFRIR
jgi:Zn-dependent peptidase ImmA (M78 family)